DRLDLVGGQRGEMGEGALFDGLAVAVGLAQQHGGWRVAIGDDVDVHAHVIDKLSPNSRRKISNYMPTFFASKKSPAPSQAGLFRSKDSVFGKQPQFSEETIKTRLAQLE